MFHLHTGNIHKISIFKPSNSRCKHSPHAFRIPVQRTAPCPLNSSSKNPPTGLLWWQKLTSPAFSLRFVNFAVQFCFWYKFIWQESYAQDKFFSGMIFLDQSQFFTVHSNQWDCFILYRQTIVKELSCVRQSGRRPTFELLFWNTSKKALSVVVCLFII